ncbi:phytanoyl-CoA dioxygenase family protein [Mesorhizobium australicum]|uniref:Phytanoyl-CoA dioxygenase (PhyH) n=1 Tax=Mesorhizobium australicum TaxID=536018 RepID=A0A1X7NJR9_9HYPH|nr:phytanoyl-CoA dioxygenase family protein [Mesorhizobium australicum]SMH37477.1 Phytanoyl-CoA dioxygenase (PhyH) [Mesorhizobium australicum]
MPAINQQGPGAAQVEHFIERGYLRLDGAFGADLAAECRDILWKAMGLSPDKPEGWTRPVVRLPFMAAPPFVAAANTPALHAAYDTLVGVDRWIAPAGLGTFPVRFPSPEDPGDSGWHVDVSFGTDAPDFMQWRVNIKSRGRALLMLFLFSDVTEADGPTKIRAGSHLDIARQLLPHGEDGMTLGELAADGFASTAHCDEALATGDAGTVYLCHPFLVHSAQPNRAGRPRFMAQPPLLPRGEFDPALPPSPVQLAIRRACNL